MLIETQREAERPSVLALKDRAVESGGAYRPLVEAFARASTPFAQETGLAPPITWRTARQNLLAADMYELASYPDEAARQLIRAARAAVRNAALDVAEHHLAAAHALTCNSSVFMR